MSMTQNEWVYWMNKTAVGLAFTTWPWQDDDMVAIEVDAGSPARQFSEYTWDDGCAPCIAITVYRQNHNCEGGSGVILGDICTKVEEHRYRKYEGRSMSSFWYTLMTGGANPHTQTVDVVPNL